MIAALQIEKMTRSEKLQAMELLWDNLSSNEQETESPAWHGDVLRETETRVASGEEKALDWEVAKKHVTN
jgi:hypothetical protein